MPASDGLLLFERAREEWARTTDIHLAHLPWQDPPTARPVIGDRHFSRLLDVVRGPDGAVHLLWVGEPGNAPGLYHGLLDPVSGQVTDPSAIPTGEWRGVREGRIVVTPGGQWHVFYWATDFYGPPQFGIWWTTWTGTGWQTPTNIAPLGDSPTSAYAGWVNRDLLRYYFAVTLLPDGDLLLVWAHPQYWNRPATGWLRSLRYHGHWGSPVDIEHSDVRGVALARDGAGTIHLVYWSGPPQTGPTESPEGRGTLLHRTWQGAGWSAPDTLDPGAGNCCASMATGLRGEVYLVWERRAGERVVPVWRVYENGQWQAEHVLATGPGEDAWYPAVAVLASGAPLFTWSARSFDSVKVGLAQGPGASIYLPLVGRAP